MDTIKYETITELRTEIQKRSVHADITYMSVVWVYNAAATFIKAMNLFVIMLLTIFMIFSDSFKYSKQFIIMGYAIILALSIFEIGIGRFIKNKILDDFKSIKYDMAWQCFTEYEGYDEMSNERRLKLFENSIVSAAGLVKSE